MLTNMLRLTALGTVLCLGVPGSATANEYEPQIREVFEQRLKPWLQNAALIEAITQQNVEHSALTETAIDALDKDWRKQAKAGGGPLIEKLLNKKASAYLADKKSKSDELVTEVFVMDNKGLNVAVSDVTSDYMQGDEAKWQKTYGTGAGQIFVDEVEFDDSTETFQCQVSATVVDPSTGQAIGAVTFGINIEML